MFRYNCWVSADAVGRPVKVWHTTGKKICNRPIHLQSYWENKCKSRKLMFWYIHIFCHIIPNLLATVEFSHPSPQTTIHRSSYLHLDLFIFWLAITSAHYIVHWTNSTSCLNVWCAWRRSRRSEGEWDGHLCDCETWQMTDMPELMSNSDVCCKLFASQAADSWQ